MNNEKEKGIEKSCNNCNNNKKNTNQCRYSTCGNCIFPHICKNCIDCKDLSNWKEKVE